MNLRVLLIALPMALLAAGSLLQAEEADANFKRAVAESYKSWLNGHAFTCVYETHTMERLQKGEVRMEFRLTVDPATKRYLYEEHVWATPNQPDAYRFYRWDGKQFLIPIDTRVLPVNGANRPAHHLADVPVGTPFGGKVMESKGDALMYIMRPMRIAGFYLDEASMDVRLAELLKDSRARLEHLEGTPEKDVTLTVGAETVTFDAQLGLIKATTDTMGRGVWRTVTRFTDRLPAEIKMKEGSDGIRPPVETVYEAIEGQCQIMSREAFEKIIQAPLPDGFVLQIVPMQPKMLRPLPVPVPKK